MTIKIAGLVPIPKNGTEKANNAMEGIDCIIFAIPITILEIVLFLVISTPIGTPIADVYKRQVFIHVVDNLKYFKVFILLMKR